MAIQARFSGVCPECGERWQPGDLIRYRDETAPTVTSTRWGGANLGAWTHAHCPDVPDPLPAARAGEVTCTTCWLIHPEGACDR